MRQLILFLLVSFQLMSCGKPSPSAGLNELIETKVDSISRFVEFKDQPIDLFRKLNFEWEELTIINPYAPRDSIKTLNYINLSPNLSKIVNMTYQDGHVQIILANRNKIITIDTVRRFPVDFAKFEGKAMSVNVLTREDVFRLIYKSVRRDGVTVQYIPYLSSAQSIGR